MARNRNILPDGRRINVGKSSEPAKNDSAEPLGEVCGYAKSGGDRFGSGGPERNRQRGLLGSNK